MPCNSLSIRRLASALPLAALLALSACGGGGSSTPAAPMTFSIGGSISGLTASGLVLTDNGGDALSVAATATSFTFATALTAGSAYAVAIKTQPQGATCSVSDGSGTANANVTSVNVTCQAITYTIGGNVSGLTTSGLVLTDNGGDALSVAANATSFTFATALDAGSAYAVAVKTQPQGATCSVSNGSGTANANVTSVAVSCQLLTFTIGGSVSGLTASGLVLADNGGDDLSVAANATSFTFATPLSFGSTYAVTVQTQPPGTTCNVSSGTGTASTNVTSVSVSCASNFGGGSSNVATMEVEPGPGSAPNIPYVTVTVCEDSTHCVQVDHVLVDTASSGLRLVASAWTGASWTPAPMADPNTGAPAGNTIAECLQFANGSLWGQVSQLTVTIGSETTGTTVPVQIAYDGTTPSAAETADCSNAFVSGNNNSVADQIAANGILGVGVAQQDCGEACGLSNTSNGVYWTCTTGGTCSETGLDLPYQVSNPVVSLPKDNNGVILQLPALGPGGAPTSTGYLVFGIDTETNNGLGSATVLTVTSQSGQFTTTYAGQTLPNSFIDSGSNGYFFPSNIPTCSDAPQFYCPTSTQSLTAVSTGQNGAQVTVPFQVANLDDLQMNDPNSFALDGIGGTAPTLGNPPWSYFDWGLPFFYGRTVAIAIDGKSAESMTGPYVAF